MSAANRIEGRAGGDAFEPISVRIPTAVAMTGFSRSRIYELIATGEIEIAKDRRSTLILVSSLREAVRRRIVARDLPIG
ncbi:AlpA family phage regulatory protein [Sphingomonas gei]|uniref:AlpA family phage regulatory protein n=1 Tax=Sphingomonas gei TaxID=1395960 RepID=A0A4S1XIL3_9SPHN|nr:AlpA family phage regulatory protein [Sphingomonas gei]TGX55847.1 AlpA family phage regulatory protein [Sphingomonas gei]